jgi:MFS family permease
MRVSATPETAEAEDRGPRNLSAARWNSGLAAWLGWLFDGLEMHLHTPVAAPFVTTLLALCGAKDPAVLWHGWWNQAASVLGRALGGGLFGRLGDRPGCSRTLSLTILTYALLTGLSSIAQTWWYLLIFRSPAAPGIGGEWAIGASLLSETWARRWRPWLAAVLLWAVDVGIRLTSVAAFLLAGVSPPLVLLVGVLPAWLVI